MLSLGWGQCRLAIASGLGTFTVMSMPDAIGRTSNASPGHARQAQPLPVLSTPTCAEGGDDLLAEQPGLSQWVHLPPRR